ncbi:MAG: nitronate monooxygenase [Oscillospiraceae bacterium]|nr:nitronate monooxygenase [Oscillospiraceae bacterium]
MSADICKILGIKYPIFMGAMTLVSESSLVAAVSNAGGLGIFATGDAAQKGGIEWARAEIRKIKQMTDKPFGVNVALFMKNVPEIIDAVCEEGVSLITTGGGNPAPYMEQLKASGVKVVPVVPNVKSAMKMEEMGADMIVAEGFESGGFIGKVATSVLLPQVTAAVKIPVIAAGGFATGRGLAAARALGASGIQMGTRFMVCKECTLPQVYKDKIIASEPTDAVVEGATLAKAVPHRSMNTPAAQEVIAYESTPDADLKEYNKRFFAGRVETTGNIDKAILGMGQVAGLIHEELTAKEIIEGIMAEYNAAVEELKAL